MSEAWKLFHLQAYFSHQRCTFSCCCFSFWIISSLLSWSGQYFLFLCIMKANNQIRYSCSKPNKLFGQGNRRKWYTLVWHTVQDNSYFNNNHHKLEQYPIYYSTAPPLSSSDVKRTRLIQNINISVLGQVLGCSEFTVLQGKQKYGVTQVVWRIWHLLIKDQSTVKS